MRKVSYPIVVISVLALSLAACSPANQQDDASNATVSDAINDTVSENTEQLDAFENMPSVDETSKRFSYQCDNQSTLDVTYINSPDKQSAVLQYQGQRIEMYSVRAASGAKYASEQGLSENDGIIWWTQGNEGTLIKMILDDSVTADDYPVIANCIAV
uniref:MliC family protein n=1 Tax=Ningiella ruwaisensis TaxID=2364274 RepID=UPI00109F34C5|nr:MliC family protein [Ningiella ruwaisensis]